MLNPGARKMGNEQPAPVPEKHAVMLIAEGLPCGGRTLKALRDNFGDETALCDLPPELADKLSGAEWTSIVDAMEAADAEVGGGVAAACLLLDFLGIGRALLDFLGINYDSRMARLAERLNRRFKGRGIAFTRGALPESPRIATRDGRVYAPVSLAPSGGFDDDSGPQPAAARRRPCVRETCLVVCADDAKVRVLEARLGDAVVLGVPRSSRFSNPDDIYDLLGPAHPGGTFELVERTLAH